MLEGLGRLDWRQFIAIAVHRQIGRAHGRHVDPADQRLHIASIADLAQHAPDLTLGSDLEFLSRIEWRGIEAAYGLRFRAQRQFQPTFMYKAAEAGQADVISAFSSDGRIAADDLVVLTDLKGAIPPYDAVILLAPRRAGDDRLRQALQPLIGKIPVQAMRTANLTVDRDQDKRSPADAARALAAAIGQN